MKSTAFFSSLLLLAASVLPSVSAVGHTPRRRHHARKAALTSSSAPSVISSTTTLDKRSSYTLTDGWSETGCILDASSRYLTGYMYSETGMTGAKCTSVCGSMGYAYAGIEWGVQCFCGNYENTAGSANLGEVLSSIACSSTCTDGSPCGGWWSLSMYAYNASSVTSTAVATASASSTSVTTSWVNQGCVSDSYSRSLTGYSSTKTAGWKVSDCTDLCASEGYSIAGIELATQCFCGNEFDNGAAELSSYRCGWYCPGTGNLCGGNWALSIYSNKTLSALLGTTTTASSSVVSSTVSSSIQTSSSTQSATATVSTAAVSTATAASSSSTKAVYVHMMVGNTYPYTYATWLADILAADAAGFDGFALNIGSDWWQWAQVASAFSAAAGSGTDFKLFLSFDMTSLPCTSYSDGALLQSYITTYGDNAHQAYYEGKILVSTFAGSSCTFGSTDWDAGWAAAFKTPLTEAGYDTFFMPSVFTDPSTFSAVDVMDGELNWNGGWPSGSVDITFSGDTTYLAALGTKKYMATVSPVFNTHYGADSWNKNWIYRSDDWLFSYRWEELIANRDKFDLVEALTWNDYGESSYIGPIEGAQPNSQAWVDGFDHTALYDINLYYATAFKTGSYPTVTEDKIYLMARPHPLDAVASDDSVPRPTNYAFSQDKFYALVFATASGTVTLTSSVGSTTVEVSAGVTRLSYALTASSTMTATLVRDDTTVVDLTPDFEFNGSPTTYNFNYYIYSS